MNNGILYSLNICGTLDAYTSPFHLINEDAEDFLTDVALYNVDSQLKITSDYYPSSNKYLGNLNINMFLNSDDHLAKVFESVTKNTSIRPNFLHYNITKDNPNNPRNKRSDRCSLIFSQNDLSLDGLSKVCRSSDMVEALSNYIEDNAITYSDTVVTKINTTYDLHRSVHLSFNSLDGDEPDDDMTVEKARDIVIDYLKQLLKSDVHMSDISIMIRGKYFYEHGAGEKVEVIQLYIDSLFIDEVQLHEIHTVYLDKNQICTMYKDYKLSDNI